MEITLYLNKDINGNANFYFEKAKKIKAKKTGLLKAIEQTKKEISQFEEKKQKYLEKKEKEEKVKNIKKKQWFDNFRWTLTSKDFLFVCGKDAITNEILLKKHLEENDLVFHTQAAGSPFGILKNGKNKASKEDINEAAQYLSCFSKQWKAGFGSADAFWVYPEQISKTAQSGEYIAKGAFMIRGDKNILKNVSLQICLGIKEEHIVDEDGNKIKLENLFAGSLESCKKHCNNRYIKLEPGQDNYKKMANEIKKKLKTLDLGELPKLIPNNCRILKK